MFQVESYKGYFYYSNEHILLRWTKKAKKGDKEIPYELGVHVDPKLMIGVRYRDLCHLYKQVVTRAAKSEKTYHMAKIKVPKKRKTKGKRSSQSTHDQLRIDIHSSMNSVERGPSQILQFLKQVNYQQNYVSVSSGSMTKVIQANEVPIVDKSQNA
ncbi:hypothetical protein M9H77_22009 [Catharanthus roseus]|uniref:Uncharacterized protein n=1 Tax=Catharanthus roseus TaxID=4058 RepID=A0ACC0AT98_CATRO|nr:hypothetical protein M9H77_22009 [Catharanthus roseus]